MEHFPEPLFRYRRLSPRRGWWVATWSLWLDEGGTHLLQVRRVFGHETYRRFFFRDIRAMTVVPTSRRAIWYGIAAVAGLLVWAVVGPAAGLLPGALVGAGIASGLALVNLWRGPGCAWTIHTGLQSAKLAAAVRRKRVDRLVAQIHGWIEAAQVGLPFPPSVEVPPPPPIPAAVRQVPSEPPVP